MASVRGRQGFCSPKRSLITVPLKPCAAQMARITIIRFGKAHGLYRVRPDQFGRRNSNDDIAGGGCEIGGRRRLAHAHGGDHLRLPDLHDQLRAAVVARVLPHAVVTGQSLGPRSVRVGSGNPEFAVGHRPTLRRRDRRSLRRSQGFGNRRRSLCARPGDHGACDDGCGVDVIGRRADRVRPLRLRLHHHRRRARQAGAAELAIHSLRLRHGCGLVRTVSVFSARRCADGCLQLADGADHLRRADVVDPAAVDRVIHAA